jgi:hypothetical protein
MKSLLAGLITGILLFSSVSRADSKSDCVERGGLWDDKRDKCIEPELPRPHTSLNQDADGSSPPETSASKSE